VEPPATDGIGTYNVSRVRTCTMIRDGHHDYIVTAHSWPAFLYAGNKCNPDNMEEGLFRNGMLVKVSLATSSDFIWHKHSQAFKYLFTSPTSANDDAPVNDAPQPSAKRAKRNLGATRSHVASLIGMRHVTPRAIAYVAVQVCLFFSTRHIVTNTLLTAPFCTI
jgi:hypothetical protein